MNAKRTLALVCVLVMSGCVSAPRETVELNENVSEQMKYIETSHRDLSRAYFLLIEKHINAFIDDQWIPSFLNRAMQNPDVKAHLDLLATGTNINRKNLSDALTDSDSFSDTEVSIIMNAFDRAKINHRVQFAEFMIDFTESVMVEINKVRETWRDNVRDSERQFIGQLDLAYSNVRTGQAQLRAYLNSVADVVEAQNATLETLGLLDERNRLVDGLADASDFFANGTDELNDTINTVNEFKPVAHRTPNDSLVLDRVLKRSRVRDDTDDASPLSEDALNNLMNELEEEGN